MAMTNYITLRFPLYNAQHCLPFQSIKKINYTAIENYKVDTEGI